MKLTKPKGTADIYGEDVYYWKHVEDRLSEIAELYNYSEIRTPIFEDTKLFSRGIGEGTDVVNKEMYTFTDKGNRSITLRPEGTAGVVRAYIENNMFTKGKYHRFYYKGPMFRYEKPQAGRMRQFHQFGVEFFGDESPYADYEVIQLAMDMIDNVGIDKNHLSLHINSIGCNNCRPNYINELKEYFKVHYSDLSNDMKLKYDRNPLRLLDSKDERFKSLIDNAPKIKDYLCSQCSEHFETLLSLLDSNGIKYVIDPKLVRGLDYYNRTAFEIIYEGLGSQNAVLGGGRYDGLVENLGGKSTPAIGFAIGMERLILTLKDLNMPVPYKNPLIYLAPLGNKGFLKAAEISSKLRKSKIKVVMGTATQSLKSHLKNADRSRVKYCIILGENEIENKIALIRNMSNGEQMEVRLEIIYDKIFKQL